MEAVSEMHPLHTLRRQPIHRPGAYWSHLRQRLEKMAVGQRIPMLGPDGPKSTVDVGDGMILNIHLDLVLYDPKRMNIYKGDWPQMRARRDELSVEAR